MLLNLTQYHRPRTVEEATALLTDRVRPLAGGTHLVASCDPQLEGVVDLSGLALDSHEHRPDGTLRLGAMLRLADLPGLSGLGASYSGALLEAARVAWPSQGKRNLSTLGGQVWAAHQRSLIGAVMIAANASFVMAGAEANDPIPAHVFYQQPRPTQQLLTQILLPTEPAIGATVIETVRALPSAIPNLGIVLHLEIEKGHMTCFRVAIGPGATQPALLEGFNEPLVGEPVADFPHHILRTALPEEAPVIDDSRGSRLYRRRILAILLERATRRALTLAETQS